MKKLLSFLAVLLFGVMCSACVNTLAVHELNQTAAEYIEKGDVKSAIARLESSIDLDDSIYETRYNLAVAYLEDNDCVSALKHIKAAQKLAPNEKNVYYTLGVANNCEADKYCATPNPDIQTLIMDTVDKQKCESFAKEANDAFRKYLELAPDANDADEVKQLIESNEHLINIPKS